MPEAWELSTEGEPRYIEADASKFLQVANQVVNLKIIDWWVISKLSD